MISGFETNTATFYTEQVTTEYDPIKDEQVETTEYAEEYIDVPVRSEQQDAEYVREVYGEWPIEVYTLYVDPLEIGSVVDDEYVIGIAANDRVELEGVTGRYSIQPPNLQRLDSAIPEHVKLEVSRVGD